MLTELSLNVLDIAQNSTRAKASLVEIAVIIDEETDIITITIKDNGCGMSEEQIEKVTDPFFTSRTTRKVGLGIPFFKGAAEMTGGALSITSELTKGTDVIATFGLSHIDRMPLGDITETIYNLVVFHEDIDFVFTYMVNNNSFTLDTREFREILEGVPFSTPEISDYIKNYLVENKLEVDGGKQY